jgi:hypothetical protein
MTLLSAKDNLSAYVCMSLIFHHLEAMLAHFHLGHLLLP